MGGHLLFDLDDSLPPRHSNKAQGYGPQPKANEPSSQGRQYVILPLGKGRCEDLDLSTVETDALVEPADVLALGFGIREEYLGRTGLEDDVVPRRVDHVRHALAHEHHRGVLLSEGPQPALHRRTEERMECRDPCLLDDEQRRSPLLQPLLDSVKEIEKDWHEMLLPERHQVGHLEDLEPALTKVLALSIEQMPEWAAQGVVGEGLSELLVLQGVHEIRHRAARALGQELKGPPESGALRRRRRNALQ